MRLQLDDEQPNLAWADVNYRADIWELETIAVDPDKRESGIGEAMLRKILEWMRDSKIKRVYFLDANDQFWSGMKKKYPKNIFIQKNMEGFLAA